MKIIRTIYELKKNLKKHQKDQIGFVPTMGFFHEGHLSLIDFASKENDIVVVSIFVNPLQFGPNEDYNTYPRDENRDFELLKSKDVNYLFIPSVSEMYPEQFSFEMSIKDRTDCLCGKNRQGHFDGVSVVLTKLFNIVQPNRAYFGLKDAQQFAVVDLLIQNLNFPIELVGLPTVREKNGLAKSSRNSYLTKEAKIQAKIIFESLQKGKEAIQNDQLKDVEEIKSIVLNNLRKNKSIKIEYVEILSYPELKQISKVNSTIIIAIAIHIEKTRLIDNFILTESGQLIKHLRRNDDATDYDAC